MTGISAVSSLGGQSEAQRNSDGINLAEDFDDFLKILLTQLQVQDPTEPMDTEAFTDQLVQFAEVEQSINQNKTLDNIQTLLTQANTVNTITAGAVDYVGKVVTVDDSVKPKTDSGARWAYVAADDTELATITVTDSTGKAVLLQSEKIAGGTNIFVWDGRDNFGQPVPNGDYKINIRAFDKGGKEVAASTDIQGTVQAVEFVNGQMQLVMPDGSKQKLEDVKSVSLPQAASSGSSSSGSSSSGSSGSSSSASSS